MHLLSTKRLLLLSKQQIISVYFIGNHHQTLLVVMYSDSAYEIYNTFDSNLDLLLLDKLISDINNNDINSADICVKNENNNSYLVVCRMKHVLFIFKLANNYKYELINTYDCKYLIHRFDILNNYVVIVKRYIEKDYPISLLDIVSNSTVDLKCHIITSIHTIKTNSIYNEIMFVSNGMLYFLNFE